MVKYYIGLHGEFDKRKYEKDFTKHISGIELCNFKSTEEVDEIYALSLSEAFDLGVHFPLYQSSYKYRDPLVTSHDLGEVEAAFDAIENELVCSKNINARYLLIHFPKPMLIDSRMDWTLVKYQAHDAIASEAYSEKSFVLACKQALIRLNALSLKHEIPIVLELEFMNTWFYSGDWFIEALDQNKALSICLDMARIHLQNHMDPGFDQYDFVRKLSKYTRVLHVANLQIRESDTVRHHPAFPELLEENGWANIEKLLSCLDDRSRLHSVLFEHRTEGIGREKVITCYEWIRSLLPENILLKTYGGQNDNLQTG